MPTDGDGLLAEAEWQGREGANRELADQLMRWIKMPNIAEDQSIPEDTLNTIANRVKQDYDLDEESRAEWKSAYEKWLDQAMQIAEEKSYPWPGASNVRYPLLTNAAIQFAARAYPSIVRDRNVVKGTVIGDDKGEPVIDPNTGQQAQMPSPDGQMQPVWKVAPGAKATRADNIGRHMSWQLLDEQEEWEPQTDRMLIVLPIVGTMFRKSYFDPGMQRNMSETVTALNLCINYKAKSFETAPRVTEIIDLYPHEIEEKIRAGIFIDQFYGENFDAGQDQEAVVTFLEQHRRWDLDGDGYTEPYIITIARDSCKLARIRAAYDEETVFFSAVDHRIRKIDPVKYYTKYPFIPNPMSNVYDVGFGHLLNPINEAINTTLNQMFDAGHLANAGGGFIGSGLSMNSGAVRFQIGEYKVVNGLGGSIRDSILPLPFQGPNPVLFSLLQFLMEAGKEIAAVKDVLSGDLPGDNVSAVTTMAVIEQGLKVFTAIHQRIHRSLKSEFKKLFRLNRIYLPVQTGYRMGDVWHEITQADYQAGAGIEPVSDPRMITDMQRLGRAQFLMQFMNDPWFNGREIRRRILDASLIDNSDALMVEQPPADPQAMAAQADLKLREAELQIRAAHEQADVQIRRGKDKADEIRILTQGILNLANAAKADAQVDQGWVAHNIAMLKLQVDALNAGSDQPDVNPAAIAGLPGAPQPNAGGGFGSPGGAVSGVAQSSGQPPVPAVPAGLPGPGGAVGA
jgi:chaperonin GroES